RKQPIAYWWLGDDKGQRRQHIEHPEPAHTDDQGDDENAGEQERQHPAFGFRSVFTGGRYHKPGLERETAGNRDHLHRGATGIDRRYEEPVKPQERDGQAEENHTGRGESDDTRRVARWCYDGRPTQSSAPRPDPE